VGSTQGKQSPNQLAICDSLVYMRPVAQSLIESLKMF